MKRALGLVLAATVAAGCGGDGDGGDAAETSAIDSEVARFESPRIGFTFEYPKELVADKRPREDVLASVGVERGSPLNAIKVRQTSRRELGPDRYLEEFRRDFERSVGAVEKREERVGDLETGVLEFGDSAELGGETVEFESTSYFFAGGGRTWQVECIADAQHRDRIDHACETALRSVDFAD